MTSEQIETKLLETFPDALIKTMDLTGGGDHWRVEIRSRAFAGKSLVEQHQMVYQALGDWMKKEIHALALDTTPLE